MAFASIKDALRYTALLRSYKGEGSSGGKAIYDTPIMIKCYPAVSNSFDMGITDNAIANKTVLYISGDIPVKEQDLIIFENGSSNWLGRDFKNTRERDCYYTKNSAKLIENKTWCCLNGTPQYWNGISWEIKFDGDKTDDGEDTEGFQGKYDIIKKVPKYFDGFGWDSDAEIDEGLSIQEVQL